MDPQTPITKRASLYSITYDAVFLSGLDIEIPDRMTLEQATDICNQCGYDLQTAIVPQENSEKG